MLQKVMNEKDFSDWGREIGDRIDKFVNSKEIRDLQENIRETVEDAMEEVRRSVQEAADYAGKFEGGFFGKNECGVNWKKEQNVVSQFTDEKSAGEAENHKGNAEIRGGDAGIQKGNAGRYRREAKRQLPVVRKPGGRVAGTLMEIFGTCGALVGWTSAVTGYLLTFISVDLFGIGIGVLSAGFAAVIAGICTAAAIVGGVWRRRARRFKKYIRTMGERDFYSIEGLARTVQKKEKFVIKDISKMIKLGWFKEGHLDEQETCFMLTNDSYQMYLDAQEQLKQRKEEEERLAKEQEQKEQDPIQKQLKLTVEEGNECIRRIREINDAIEGEDISGKLYRLEKICAQIFEHIGENPEKLPDIRRFMSYYLPTTLKLVERYHEFNSQPVQGENIAAAKKEIEDMLDDINTAFEKMFDKLFEDAALDVSTDISVLSTMLAQEGLLEEELKVK